MQTRACHWEPVAKLIKSDSEAMLTQLAQWDPRFRMIEIDNIEMVDESNPAGDAAQIFLLESVDSISVMQRCITQQPPGNSSPNQSASTPNLETNWMDISQQQDSNFKHPPSDDESIITYQDSDCGTGV
jgi:hypothetical protein